MKPYYSMWKSKKNQFDEPVIYDYTFNVRFPNIVFNAKNRTEAKKKIEAINQKIKYMDRFDLSQPKILRMAL